MYSLYRLSVHCMWHMYKNNPIQCCKLRQGGLVNTTAANSLKLLRTPTECSLKLHPCTKSYSALSACWHMHGHGMARHLAECCTQGVLQRKNKSEHWQQLQLGTISTSPCITASHYNCCSTAVVQQQVTSASFITCLGLGPTDARWSHMHLIQQ